MADLANAPQRKRKRQLEENLVRSYVGKIVKEYESGITGDALNMLQRIVMGCLHDLANVVNVSIATSRSMKTISDQDIRVATEILYGVQGSEACGRCLEFIDARLKQYVERDPATKGQKSAIAGLVLPVTALVKKFMSLITPYVDAKKKIMTHRKKDAAGVALAASLEFLTREIVSQAVEKSTSEKRNRVIPTHISATVEATAWLKAVLRNYVMQGALTFTPPVAKTPKEAKTGKVSKTGKGKATEADASKTPKAKAAKAAKASKAAKPSKVGKPAKAKATKPKKS